MLLSELPLTQLLLKGDVAWNGNFDRDADPKTEIFELGILRRDTSIKFLFDNYLSGKREVSLDAVYMFSKLYSTDICISNPQGGIKASKLKYQTKPRIQKILWKHTRWFPLLKHQVRESLIQFIRVNSDRTLDLSRFRRVLEAVDHIVTGFFLSGEKQSVINRIQVALISNLVVTGESGYFQYLKSYKSLVKGLRKAVLSGGSLPELKPEFHWIKATQFWLRLNQAVSNPATGWEQLQHVMVVLQTRSTGLANGPWENDSLVKWIQTTSNKESNYSTEFIRKGAETLSETIKDNGIISLTAASCVESSRKDGGKFSELREIISYLQDTGTHLVDWETGKVSNVVTKLPQNFKIQEDWGEGLDPFITPELGHYLFSYALNEFRSGYDSQKVNLSTVIEQGKARIVTPNSVILYLLTMPLSHSTLRCFESIEELRVGVSSTNDAWEFWKRIRPSERNDGGYSNSFICADLETATDFSPFELVEATLDIMKKLGIQTWYIDLTKKLLASPRWYLHKERRLGVHRTERGALMADPGTKSILSLSHYLIIKSIEKDLDLRVVFAIKGDDIVIQLPRERSEEFMRIYRTRMSKSGFVLSEDDTFISNTYAFYCEGLFRNYHLTSESPTSWDSLVNTTNPSYCDIPTVKLAFPVFKNNYRIGETPEGKISLLSKRRSYFREQSYARFQYEILDIIQSLTFRLDEYDLEFLFGAKWRGGLSKPITPYNREMLNLSDATKRKVMVDYLFIINRVLGKRIPSHLKVDDSTLESIFRFTNKFYLRTDNDDEKPGEFKMIDFNLNLPEIWNASDEREWGLAIGSTLLSIKGFSTDKSIKSKIVTLHNLSEIPMNIEERITQQSLDDQASLLAFSESLNLDHFDEVCEWYQRIRIEQYPYVNWSIHLEKDFPLYNAMKVNPKDYKDTELESDIRCIISQRNEIQANPEILDVLKDHGLTRKQLVCLRLALQLHGRKNVVGQINETSYQDAIESTTDMDEIVALKLARLYSRASGVLEAAASAGLNPTQIRENLNKEIPHRFILWFSADSTRFKILEEMNQRYLDQLNISDNLRWLFKIHLARYVPKGTMTEYGYMIESYIRQEGYVPNVPKELTDDDMYGEFFDDAVGFDFDNLESIAQSVREGTHRERGGVYLQGPRQELGFSISEDIPGLLTS